MVSTNGWVLLTLSSTITAAVSRSLSLKCTFYLTHLKSTISISYSHFLSTLRTLTISSKTCIHSDPNTSAHITQNAFFIEDVTAGTPAHDFKVA